MLETIKNFILEKTAENGKKSTDLFPHCTQGGKYKLLDECSWIGGFWPGLNFICYEMSGDVQYIDSARACMPRLKGDLDRMGASLGHDLGFLFSLSFYADYLLSGSEESKQVTIQAADTLMERYRAEGDYFQAWDVFPSEEHAAFFAENTTRMIIDCMYNMPLLYRAAEITGDRSYYDAAYKHSKTAQAHLVRKDGTTAHTFVFNVDGSPKYEQTWQGFADDSCWARGQAWAATGFALAYKFTKDESFLQTAKACADVFLRDVESDMIPKWDLSLKGDDTQSTDTSAASIAACGMMDIYDLTGEAKYKESAEKILFSLYENYSSKDKPEFDGLIDGATGHKPLEVDVNCALIYGDYYFAELAARLLEKTKTYW